MLGLEIKLFIFYFYSMFELTYAMLNLPETIMSISNFYLDICELLNILLALLKLLLELLLIIFSGKFIPNVLLINSSSLFLYFF